MIIVVDSIRGNSGQGVPMYSRAGKSTINQFLVFANKSEKAGNSNEYTEDENQYYDENVEKELKILMVKEEEQK